MRSDELETMESNTTVGAPAPVTLSEIDGALTGPAAEPRADPAPTGVAAPAPSDSPAAPPPAPTAVAAPVPADIPAVDPVASARNALLNAYSAILRQIHDLARGDRSDRVAQLAEAAAALVKGDFASRLVFESDQD